MGFGVDYEVPLDDTINGRRYMLSVNFQNDGRGPICSATLFDSTDPDEPDLLYDGEAQGMNPAAAIHALRATLAAEAPNLLASLREWLDQEALAGLAAYRAWLQEELDALRIRGVT